MFKLGSQFMPPLFEGSSLYMPTALPGISITQASQLLQTQDRIIKSFPEAETVFGAVGRSDSATDNAPLDMYDTTVMLKPREKWRPGMTYEKLIREMDEKLQFPGLTNTWTMPVQNRLDMALTGIKTPVGMKLQGPNLEQIQQLGAQVQQILSGLPQARSVFAERENRTALRQTRENLLDLCPELLDLLQIRALKLHSNRRLNPGQRHVQAVLNRHGPGVCEARKLELLVHFANELFVGHSGTPLLTWLEHQGCVIHI